MLRQTEIAMYQEYRYMSRQVKTRKISKKYDKESIYFIQSFVTFM